MHSDFFSRVKEFLERHLNQKLEASGPDELKQMVPLLDSGNTIEVTLEKQSSPVGDYLHIRMLMFEGHSIIGAERDFRFDEADEAMEWVGQELTQLLD